MSENAAVVGPTEWDQFHSLLIVKPSSLGDIVHTLPAVAALRQHFPEWRIRWLANTEWMALLQGSPVVDEVIEFPRRNFRGLSGLGRYLQWGWRFRKEGTADEMVVDFQGLFRSGLTSFVRGSGRVIGASDARELAGWFHQSSAKVPENAHSVDRYVAVVETIVGPISRENLTWPLPPGERPFGWPEGKTSPILVLHPYSRGAGKALEMARVLELVDRWSDRQVAVVGRSEAPIPGLETRTHVVDFTNRSTLPQLIWMLAAADAVVSVDSGPMHIASAVNERTLGIHTWSDPRRVGPYRLENRVWKAGRIARRDEFSTSESLANRPFDAGAVDAVALWALEASAQRR